MFRHLLINTLASATAFLAISIVGFLLVPVLIGSYGLKEFGLILLARMFLPTGVLVLFDFGFSEITSQLVAEARETNDWARTSAGVSALFATALCVGVALGLVLLLAAKPIALFFGVGGSTGSAFANVFRITGLVTPILFVTTVLEGVVKGYGAFRSLRSIEVISTLGYAATAVTLAANHSPYQSIAYVYLAFALVRGALVAANAKRAGLTRALKINLALSRAGFPEVAPRCKVMAHNRLLGTLQGPAQQPLMGFFVGPAGVGMYDILTRLPRFAKAAIGLLGSALIPVAASLDASDDVVHMRKLMGWGLLLTASAAIPPLAGAALLSEPLLRLWVGATYAAYWYWHSLMFVVPVSAAVLSFGSTALLVRPRAMSRLNLINTIQLAGQYALALLMLGYFQERAFILAQCVSVVIASMFLLTLLMEQHELPAPLLLRLLAIGLAGLILATAYILLWREHTIDSWSGLAIHFCVWCVTYWGAIWLFVLYKTERGVILDMARSLLPPLGRAPRDPDRD